MSSSGYANRPITLNGRFLLQAVTGVQRVAREVLHSLDDLAHAGEIPAPQVLLPARGDVVAAPRLKAITLSRVGIHSGHIWEQLDLPKHCTREPLLCLGNTAPLARLYAPNRPTVTMVHDLSYRYFPGAYSRRFRYAYGVLIPQVLRRSEAVVTVSQAEATQIARHFPLLHRSGRLSVLQNGGIPDDAAKRAFAEDGPPASERNYGIYVGSLTRRKNASGLLRAAIAFLRAYPDMEFVVIGANSAAVFEQVAFPVPLEVAGRLHFRGQINDAEVIYHALRGARFMLFLSFYEASPLPPVEAMTYGCPVIAAEIPSLRERCGRAAIYCDPGDHDSVMTAIESVMEKPGYWETLSEAAKAQAARYSWVEQTRGLLQLCESVR